MNNIVSGLYAVYIAYNVNVLLLYLTTLCRLKSADRVFWSCFPAKNHTWQAKPYSAMAGKSCSAKEYNKCLACYTLS